MHKLKLPHIFGLRYEPKNFISSKKTTQRHQVDIRFLGAVVFLCLFGLLMVYDASQVEAFRDFGDKYYFIRQQIIWVTLGFIALTFFSFFDYHHLKRFATPFFLISFILLLLVFIPGLGISAGGAHRWLKISFLTIQPAEIIKLSSIIFFAALFQKQLKAPLFLLITAAVIAIVGIFQRDLGTAVVFSMIAFGLYFVAGAKIAYFLGLLFMGGVSFIGFILSSAYRKQRVLAFLDPFSDPQGFSYHISQVLIALGSGGLFGLGIGQSRQKYSFIPEVTTDSIFSVVGEELGLIGSIILISLIGFFIIRGFKIAESAPDNFGKLLASGLAIWLGTQVVINLAAMVSLIPLTGVPLPFISYGGSALLANLVAVGILLNISRQS